MIAYEQARTIVDQALAHARGRNFPPMTVAVLEPGGHLVAFAREDHSSLLRERIAVGKARGALNMGVGSRSLAARADAHPHFINSLVALSGGDLVPVPGGVLILDADQIVGAVGVSGHLPDKDEECAIKGIESTGLTADPGTDSAARSR
ncbi:heme-binding protein [Streptomyces sp. NPDC091972]|uniref:GlcG/HbpS family heme-binding protein n=1 Tax=Streptomyces sp. NPDC091972 TaxID=3366007 RepID=UPI0037F5A24C